MKKVTLFLLFVSPYLTGCGKFRDGTSIWQGGLWLIVVLPLIGAALFFRAAYKSSKSGSTTLDGKTRLPYESGNVPILKIPLFWFGVALVVAAIVFTIMVNSDK